MKTPMVLSVANGQKKMSFRQITKEEIEAMEFQINSMPRKVLGGLTPLEDYTGRTVALIA